MKQLSRAKIYEQQLAAAREGWVPFDYSARLIIPDRTIMVLADVHLPRHDEKLLAQALARAEEQKVQAIVFLGDLMDMPTFSAWGRDDMSDNFERELNICEAVIRCALSAVKYVYWSFGNHEGRFMRKLDGQLSMRHLAQIAGLSDVMDAGRLIVSDNPSLDAFDGNWMLTHPVSYGATPLVVPGKIATRYEQNVLSAHAHHYGSGTDQTGKWVVVESGGLFDTRYHRYMQYGITTHRAWVQGYWILDGGVPTGYRPVTAKADAPKGLGLLERRSA